MTVFGLSRLHYLVGYRENKPGWHWKLTLCPHLIQPPLPFSPTIFESQNQHSRSQISISDTKNVYIQSLHCCWWQQLVKSNLKHWEDKQLHFPPALFLGNTDQWPVLVEIRRQACRHLVRWKEQCSFKHQVLDKNAIFFVEKQTCFASWYFKKKS